ncbi:ParA family protein [Vibrio alginolyticus]
MSVIEDLRTVGQRMVKEQSSLKDLLAKERVMNVTDDTVNGVDRLIYNHCLNKTDLAASIGIARNTLVKYLSELEENNEIAEPIQQGKNHLYSRHAIQEIMEKMGTPKYSDYHNPVVMCIENQKGGTGKSSTATTLAVATALDLSLNARVCLVDLDPQGTLASNLIQNADCENSLTLTAIDIVLGEQEAEGEFSYYRQSGHSEEEIVLAAPFSTHLPNLDIIASHPNDERFNDEIAKASNEKGKHLYERFRDVLISNLKKEYDIIIVDSAPHDAPIVWAINECADGILIPVMPNEFDFSSTSNFIASLPERLVDLPSRGENLKWFRVLPVNYNAKSISQRKTLDKLTRTVQDKMLSTQINRSELFPAAASAGRTVLDVMKSEKMVSPKQFDLAISSVESVYRQIKSEIIALAAKEV